MSLQARARELVAADDFLRAHSLLTGHEPLTPGELRGLLHSSEGQRDTHTVTVEQLGRLMQAAFLAGYRAENK